MKNLVYPLVFIALGGELFAQPALPPSPAFAWAAGDDPATIAVRSAGEQLIDRVGNTLIMEVERTLAQNTPEDSLKILHLKSISLPPAAVGQPRATGLKLTSLRVRNAANTPDPADFAALDFVDRALRAGDGVPKILVQKIESTPGQAEWRVYRPIAVNQKCLLCHGKSETLQPEVRQMLERLYPEDKATGYAAREWRGLIRVSYEVPAALTAGQN